MADPTIEGAVSSLLMPGEEARAFLPATPDPRCPFCVALAALPYPAEGEGRALRTCPPHLALLRRLQCRGWNADLAHQAMAGRASFDAFSARWRAASGIAPLSAAAARKYVTPDDICGPLGGALTPALRGAIHRAWCAGALVGVAAWLDGDPPQEPGGLWAGATPPAAAGEEVGNSTRA